jgi:hypothetical protein
MIRIAVATPTNRKVTVPRATAHGAARRIVRQADIEPEHGREEQQHRHAETEAQPPLDAGDPRGDQRPAQRQGRRTISRATVSTPNSFPQTNSAGSKSLTRRRSSDPRSRSVVTLVTASAVTATRLASTIGTTASDSETIGSRPLPPRGESPRPRPRTASATRS